MISTSRHLALDVQYQGNSATAAGIVFPTWDAQMQSAHYTAHIDTVADYQPGHFYLRELPCLEKIIQQVGRPLTTIVIDGYVTLGDDQRPGLGMQLWRALGESVPIIGVAKTAFQGTPSQAQLLRGTSKKPLFISCVGISLEEGKLCIASMHGEHRIPTLLKNVDRLCRHPK